MARGGLCAALAVGALITTILAARPHATQASVTSEDVAQVRIVVAPPVRVSEANSSKPHEEVQIAADPSDAKLLIACSMMFSDDDVGDERAYLRPRPFSIVVYTSQDGGLSWRPTYSLDNHQHHTDPTCAFGPDGTAYWMSLGGDLYAALSWSRQESIARGSKQQFMRSPRPFIRMAMFRSSDRAKTWRTVGEIDAVDRDYITVDDTSGKNRGRVYVHGIANGVSGIGVAGVDGARLYGLVFSHSTNRGETYESVRLASEGSRYPYLISNGVVMSDGTFATIFGETLNPMAGWSARDLHPEAPNAQLKFISSEDGGETFDKATVISDWYLRYDTLPGTPSLAVDRTLGSFKDRIYAAWVDARSGRGEVRFSRSDDKGKTWVPSFVISDNWPQDVRGETPDAFMPTLAVNRNGVLGAMWYDRRDHADNLGYDIRFSASLDGGESFLPSVLVSRAGGSALQMKEAILWGPWYPSADAHFDLSQTIDSGGDTAGLACDAEGVFHPLWIDRRSGLQQVATTRISVYGNALPNGGGGLESLRDLSAQVQVRYSLAHVDLSTNVMTIGAAISNSSKEPISGLLTLRLVGLSSSNGRIEVQNADNGVTNIGATWHFHSKKGELLEPGDLTLPRQLRFKFALPFSPPSPLSSTDQSPVELRTKIMGE